PSIPQCLLCRCFLSSGCGVPPALHSFPTRRSSDLLTEPYAGYHGINYAQEFGPAAFAMRARTEGLRDFGAIMEPQTAFYILQGRSEEHTSELQSRENLVCRLLLEKKKTIHYQRQKV